MRERGVTGRKALGEGKGLSRLGRGCEAADLGVVGAVRVGAMIEFMFRGNGRGQAGFCSVWLG